MTYPTQLPDPRTRSELKDWFTRRKELLKQAGLPEDTPLTAREYLMVQRLGSSRPKFSLM